MPKYTYWYYSGSLHTCTKTFRIKIWLEAIGEPSLLQCTLLLLQHKLYLLILMDKWKTYALDQLINNLA